MVERNSPFAEAVDTQRAGITLSAAPRGSLLRASVDFSEFLARPCRETVPTCPGCGALLRPHVLWFDEYYSDHRDYQIDAVLRAAMGEGRCGCSSGRRTTCCA